MTWSIIARDCATERLGMVAPGDSEAVVLERVAAQEPPAKSVVASR